MADQSRVIDLTEGDVFENEATQAAIYASLIDLTESPPPTKRPRKEGDTRFLQILEMFPDIEEEFLKQKLKDHSDIDSIIQDLMSTEYPRKKKAPFIDYYETSSFEPSPAYVESAIQALQGDFTKLTQSGATKILKHFKNHYAPAHRAITRVGHDQDKLLEAFHFLKKTRDVRKRGGSGIIVPTLDDPIFQQEYRFVQEEVREQREWDMKEARRQRNTEQAVQANTAMDCHCCYSSAAVEDMVSCQDGHLFCVDCLQNYAKTQIFGNGNFGTNKETKKPNTQLMCMTDCQASFSLPFLEKALTTKMLHKYSELQTDITLRLAQVDFVQCPNCNGKETSLAPTQRVLVCSQCQYESCRECGKAAHVPWRCGEQEADQAKTKGRTAVEEAISNAKIRQCPKCQKSILKESGCNKMKCACGQLFCYLCRKKIKSYQHFCQVPHCTHENCGNCRLHSNTEYDDALAMREAGLSAASQVQDENVKIDVDGILKDPGKRR